MTKRLMTESLVSEMKLVEKEQGSPALCVMEGPCMEFDKVNRNNRIYSKKLVENRIINNKEVQEAIKNKSMLGEGGHPETRVEISYPEVALCVEKLWIPDNSKNLLWGRFAILDTPVGRILETLVRYGSSIGISARAMTDSVERDGHEVISETNYDLITFDAVPDPGFKCARLSKVESAMRPIDSMSLTELESARGALRSSRVPAFESRIQMLGKEISRRKSIDLGSEVSELRKTLDLLKKTESIKKVEDLEQLMSAAKSLIEETRATIHAKERVSSDLEEEIKRLSEENRALREQIKDLDIAFYKKDFSADYEIQMNRIKNVLLRLENLNTDSKRIAESYYNRDLSKRTLIKEGRIKALLSKSEESRFSSRDLQKIAQFERESESILTPSDSTLMVEDSLTRAVNAQVRR